MEQFSMCRTIAVYAVVALLAGCGGPQSQIGASGAMPSTKMGATSASLTHVLTADYLGGRYGTHSISWSQAAPYLTWAETDQTDVKSIHDVGIKTLDYVDPNRTAPGNPLYNDNNATFAHTCSQKRIYTTEDGAEVWVMNPRSSAMQDLFAQFSQLIKKNTAFNAFFEDDAGALSAAERYDPFHPSLPCGYSNQSWIKAQIALNEASSVPIVFNGLNEVTGYETSLGPSRSIGLLAGSNAIGGNFEGCYSTTAGPKQAGSLWQTVETTELIVNAKNKLFECMVQNTGDADEQTDARIYAYASFLLTYAPSTSIYWTYFNTPSGLHVMPESELVALSPKTPTPQTISGLKQSGGTYARQYKKCYIRGTYVSECAAVVNSDWDPHPFPFSQYHHTLTISGNGVLDGGTISTNGPAPPSTLPKYEAVIAFP
jgi:hypothetical protein